MNHNVSCWLSESKYNTALLGLVESSTNFLLLADVSIYFKFEIPEFLRFVFSR